MRNLLLLVTACALFAAACHSSHSGGGRHSAYPNNQIPKNVMEKLPGLAKAGKYDEALDLLRPYAEQGNPEAQFNMALGLALKGGELNDDEIVQWTRKSAAQNYPQALGFLANAYQFGMFGLPTNEVMSAMWTSAETNSAMITKCLDYERDELKVAH